MTRPYQDLDTKQLQELHDETLRDFLNSKQRDWSSEDKTLKRLSDLVKKERYRRYYA